MSNTIKQLFIIDGENPHINIFSIGEEFYSIPLYQRAFAWEDIQLTQLVEDIWDVDESRDDNYYLGSLIVSKQGNKYEVVDGQQRLTSLFLLLNCLGISCEKKSLQFACRDKSNYTLENIEKILDDNEQNNIDSDRIESGIQNGIKILQELMSGYDKEQFLSKLSRVVLFRIEVPKHTDLNRYFEIMNTRGEQLEQHDILKATLMSYLKNGKDQVVFSKIWDACSDMNGYVQMHFVSKKNAVRNELFGQEWGEMPPNDWSSYRESITIDKNVKKTSINDIIAPNFVVEEDEGYLDNGDKVRFESVISFPYFLIHTLKVYIELFSVTHEEENKVIIARLLDDKKLIETFKTVINSGCTEKGRISDDKGTFVKQYIMCLLRTRFLFDKYIIKREYSNDDLDGEWSLKQLRSSGQESKKKPYYKNTSFLKSREWDSTNDYRTKTNIMIQSALRVSYTSPKVMHWITDLLIWLSENDCKHVAGEYISGYSQIAEKIANNAVKTDFLENEECINKQYAMGVDTPHIVFNYLDYLIWNSNRKKYDNFVFEFRNSVEHWYPRNPSERRWNDEEDPANNVDRFGNLCIIQRSINSRFSNMDPEAKKSTFKEMIEKGSLKLRLMSEDTISGNQRTASQNWKDSVCAAHEGKMLEILKEACGLE